MTRRSLHPEAAKALGRKLSEQRMKLNKTQQEVADFAGMSRGYYRTLERGAADYGTNRVSNPTVAMVVDLAMVLELPAADLIQIVIDNHGTVDSTSMDDSASVT